MKKRGVNPHMQALFFVLFAFDFNLVWLQSRYPCPGERFRWTSTDVHVMVLRCEITPRTYEWFLFIEMASADRVIRFVDAVCYWMVQFDGGSVNDGAQNSSKQTSYDWHPGPPMISPKRNKIKR